MIVSVRAVCGSTVITSLTFRELMALETLLACASKASTAPRSSRSAPL
jgi:hypothetical protein